MERKAWIEPFDARILAEGIQLDRHELVGVRNGRGALVFVESGTAWITQENDQRDVIVAAGDWFRLDREGVALVQAYRSATVTVTAPLDGVERAVFRPGAVAQGRGTFMRRFWAVWLRYYQRRARPRTWEIRATPASPAPRAALRDPVGSGLRPALGGVLAATARFVTLAAGLALAAPLLDAAAQVATLPTAAGYLPAHFTAQGEIEPHPPQF